jgi:hypothetical protein
MTQFARTVVALVMVLAGGAGLSGISFAGRAQAGGDEDARPLIMTCEDDCEWDKKECDNDCRRIPENERKKRERCWRICEEKYADCLKKCK